MSEPAAPTPADDDLGRVLRSGNFLYALVFAVPMLLTYLVGMFTDTPIEAWGKFAELHTAGMATFFFARNGRRALSDLAAARAGK